MKQSGGSVRQGGGVPRRKAWRRRRSRLRSPRRPGLVASSSDEEASAE